MGHYWSGDGMADDWLITNTATAHMLAQLQSDMQAGRGGGFLGDIVAEFPEDLEAARNASACVRFRQLNISAWTSREASRDWWVRLWHLNRELEGWRER